MIAKILKIRIKQLSRIIHQIGIFRTLFLSVLLSFTVLFLFLATLSKSNIEIITAAYLLLILIIHLKRKDKFFLNFYSDNPQRIFFVEYFLLSLPLILSLIYSRLWYYLIISTTLLIIISFLKINIKKSSANTIFQKFIPDDNFEWKSGIRKNLIFIILIWFAGITTSFYIASVPIAIFILGITVLGFYETPEPLQILIANELNVRKFLSKKIKNHLAIFSVLLVPLALLFTIFNTEYYYIVLIEYVILSFLLVYTILLKYAFYQPNIKSGTIQIFTMIGIIGIFIPVFIPVILLLSIKFLFQAFNNLKFYLNDFN